MKLNYIASIVLILAAILVAGCCCMTSSQVESPTSSGYNRPTVKSAPTIASTPISEPLPINLLGDGNQATDKFQLRRGLSVFTMKYDGSHNFIVELKDHNGELADLLANEIGSFDGSKAVGIDSTGDYIINVQDSGPWTITIT